jgi:hypothetical protein
VIRGWQIRRQPSSERGRLCGSRNAGVFLTTFAGWELIDLLTVSGGASSDAPRSGAELTLPAKDPGLLLVAQAIALAADVQHTAVVEEIENRDIDLGVADDLAPLTEALRGQDNAAALATDGENVRGRMQTPKRRWFDFEEAPWNRAPKYGSADKDKSSPRHLD